MRRNNLYFRAMMVSALFSTGCFAVVPPVSLNFPLNGQLQLSVSNTNPNLIVIPGDRIVAINSAPGKLTDKRNTQGGAVLFSSTSEKTFTLFIETEHGQVFSVQAMPQASEGRSYRLLNVDPIARPAAKAWETAQPYESLLVELNKAVLQNRVPEGYTIAALQNDRTRGPAGLSMSAEEAWTGNALRVVRYRVTNPHSYPITLKEQHFWRQGIRAVMFSQQAVSLLPGASLTVYITRTQEVGNGQH